MELLNDQAIRSAMQNDSIALLSEIEILPSVDSTNRYALDKNLSPHLSSSFLNTGYVCLAEEQTAGRGRQGNHWVSPYASNIYLSLLWRFPTSFSISNLSLAVGVSIAKAMQRYGLEAVKLKWPNDVIYFGRKLAGILVETTNESQGNIRAVIGIGLNVSMPANVDKLIDQPWIDIQTITGQIPQRNQLVGWLLNELLLMLPDFQTQGFSAFRNNWEALDGLQGFDVTVQTSQEIIKGKAVGIDPNGCLLVQCGRITHRFQSGEVHVRRMI
jgi:BirA family biotin operon repressor/biotin-[acetyl-CoA-carboxylase] ligase